MLRQTEIIAKKYHIILKCCFNCWFLAIYSETQQVTCSAVFNEYA